MYRFIFPFLFIISIILSGCAASEKIFYDLPVELRNADAKTKFLKEYVPYISGRKIFLDPGHGGEDRKNIGFRGIAVEADVNLKVALYLREFLAAAGAEVFMSRDKDVSVGLKERSLMANNSSAEIFISIHHNAPGGAGDNWTNYTSTYYHAKETDYEYEPCGRDLARYVQRDLAYAMRNSGGLGSFDGTYSDYNIYPGAGFSVLRLTEIPAVLVEAGFHTHDYEERRLAINEFNRIQAWGIFRGLCRYFKAGIPKIAALDSINTNSGLFFQLSDSSGIAPASIKVSVDTLVTEFTFDAKSNILNVNIEGLTPGEHSVRVIAANKNGNHAFPFRHKVIINLVQQ